MPHLGANRPLSYAVIVNDDFKEEAINCIFQKATTIAEDKRLGADSTYGTSHVAVSMRLSE